MRYCTLVPILCTLLLFLVGGVTTTPSASAQSTTEPPVLDFDSSPEEAEGPTLKEIIADEPIFDDRMLLDGYTQKYAALSQDVIAEMIKDETLDAFKTAAAVKVFINKYSQEIVAAEKRSMEKTLLRRLNRADSPFLQVQIMHALVEMDRYRYFKHMVVALIQKLDHYNAAVNSTAFEALMDIIRKGNSRSREARLVFNMMRKNLFLSRKRLAAMETPTPRIKQKVQLLRWAIKILGTQELKRLPHEVIPLL